MSGENLYSAYCLISTKNTGSSSFIFSFSVHGGYVTVKMHMLHLDVLVKEHCFISV